MAFQNKHNTESLFKINILQEASEQEMGFSQIREFLLTDGFTNHRKYFQNKHDTGSFRTKRSDAKYDLKLHGN